VSKRRFGCEIKDIDVVKSSLGDEEDVGAGEFLFDELRISLDVELFVSLVLVRDVSPNLEIFSFWELSVFGEEGKEWDGILEIKDICADLGCDLEEGRDWLGVAEKSRDVRLDWESDGMSDSWNEVGTLPRALSGGAKPKEFLLNWTANPEREF